MPGTQALTTQNEKKHGYEETWYVGTPRRTSNGEP